MYCVVGQQTHSYFTGFLYLPKNIALSVRKLWRKNLSKSVFGYFKTKKKVLGREGGLKALVDCPLKKERDRDKNRFITCSVVISEESEECKFSILQLCVSSL